MVSQWLAQRYPPFRSGGLWLERIAAGELELERSTAGLSADPQLQGGETLCMVPSALAGGRRSLISGRRSTTTATCW